MNIAKKLSVAIILYLISFLSIPQNVYAVCPVCTIAVGAGLGLSRWLGIDDVISGIWTGGLTLSLSLWFNSWIEKKGYLNTKFRFPITLMITYSLVLVPLWLTKTIGHPYNTVLGIDKLLFGTTIGSLVFSFGVLVDKKVRKVKGKQFFHYQKIILPVTSLLIASIILYYYGGYLYKV